MTRKKKDLFYFECELCGKKPEKDEKTSNENWNVYSTKCECGGKIIMKFYE